MVSRTIEQLQGKKPSEILPAEVRAKVLVATGLGELAGSEITFPFFAIHWESVDCEPGGVAIDLPGHPYCAVELESMIFTGSD